MNMKKIALCILLSFSAPAWTQGVGNGDSCCLMKQKEVTGEGKEKKEIYRLSTTFAPTRDCQTGKNIDGRTICGTSAEKEECSSMGQEKICQKCGLTWNKEESSCGQKAAAAKKDDPAGKTAKGKTEPADTAAATPTPTPTPSATPHTVYERGTAPKPTPVATPIQGSRRGY